MADQPRGSYEPLILHRNERFHVSLLANERPRVILTGAWHRDVADYMAEHEIGDLSLNTGCGWTGGGIEFLADAPRIRSVAILDWHTRDLRPLVAHASSLEELILECNVKQTPTLAELPALQNLVGKWSPGLDGLFDGVPHRLRELAIQNWPYEHLQAITPLRELSRLTIIGSRRLRDLSALENRTSIELLRLYRCPSVPDYEVLATCSGLRDLDITSKVISRLDFVRPLARLERLVVDDSDIETLAPIASLMNLKIIAISGRVLDADLSVLLTLPALTWAGIRRGKKYKPSVREINARCEQRPRWWPD